MFLTKNIYVGAEYEHRNVKIDIDLSIDGRKVDIDLGKVSEISVRVGYWRKANAIHRWFVENVQGGEDECQKHYVSNEQLEQLRKDCVEVLAHKDKRGTILPTGQGFFFGGTEYDEYYFQDIEDTLEILDGLENDQDGSIYYQSSW